MRANITLGRGEIVTSDGVVNYNFTFPIEADSHVSIYLDSTLFNRGFDYSIFNLSDTGFTVSLANNPGADHKLIAILDVPLEQTLDLIRSGGIPAEALEDKFDFIIQIVQMFAERLKRVPMLAPYSLDEDILLPDYSADKWLKYHPTLRQIELADPPSGAPGLQGPAGPGILFGSGAPAGGLGTPGATYIDTDSGDIYSKTGASTWTLQGNITGPKGDPGADGVSTTAGAAFGSVGVVGGHFVEGAMGVTVDLTSFALANASYAIKAIPSWQTQVYETINSATSATFSWTSAAPSNAVVRFMIIAQGDISGGGTTITAHDHTSGSGDGGILTRTEFDQYTQHNAVSEPSGDVPATKVRIWFDGSAWKEKILGVVRPLGYYTHSHSTVGGLGGDGGTLTAPQLENYFDLKHIAAPGSPSSTYHRFYVDSADDHLKRKRNAGTIVDYDAALAGTSIGSYGVRGLIGQNNAFPNTQFEITADVWIVRNSSNNNLVIQSPGTKTLNIATFGAGGRDQSAAFAASNWIYVYGIYNGATATVLASLTVPPTGPALPAGYTHWNFLVALRINSSGNLVSCRARGDRVYYDAPQNILTSGSATVETAVSIGTVVPPKALDYELVPTLRPSGTVGGSDLDIFATIRLASGGSDFLVIDPFRAGFGLGDGRYPVIVNAPYVSSSVFYFLSDASSQNQAPRMDMDVRSYRIPNDG